MTNSNTVLVVDDSPTELKLVSTTLAQKGYRVVSATDGEEALTKALVEKPSVMVLDIVLPKKNGFQVCRQLKTTPDTQGIKIILLSSKSQDSDRFWGLQQGADEYLTKPWTEPDLLKAVARFM
jgi:twitching motility two-component system response regulator PilH